MVTEGRRRWRRVVGRVAPPRRRGGGQREMVPAGAAAVVPAAVPVQEVPPIRRRRRHPRRRCRRPSSNTNPQLRPAPQITYARRSQLRGVTDPPIQGRDSQGPRRRAGRQVSPGAPGVGPTRQPKHLAGREDEGRPPGEEAAAACGDAKRTGDAAGAQSRLASRGGEGGQAGGGC